MSLDARSYLPSIRGFLNLIYPRVCLECGVDIKRTMFRETRESAPRDHAGFEPPHNFCPPCWGSIRRLEGPACPVCATPFSSETALSHSPAHLCGDCREDPPAFTLAISPYAYEGVIAKAIHSFKYQHQSMLSGPLASLFISDLRSLQVDTVMAIPLHPTRLREREFNQSLLLANQVSRLLAIPLSTDALERIRETPPQVGLSRKKRKKNIHRAFQIRHADFVQGQRILLIDDVYTTGATLREGAKTLIRGGAKNVVVAALARMISS